MSNYNPSVVVHSFIIRMAEAGDSMKKASEFLAEKFSSRYYGIRGKELERNLRVDLSQINVGEEVTEK